MRLPSLRRPLRRDHWQRKIAQLDPETDWPDISSIVFGHEFPWDIQRSTELALFRTYAVPEIGELLAATRAFIDDTEKRFDDTAIVLVESGLYVGGESDDATAIRRLNQMHGAYDIPNDQMLYVLSTFVVTPCRWIDRYGYRKLTEAELVSIVRYWQRFGQLMGIRDIPPDYAGFADYYDTYERDRFAFSSGGRAVADATLGLLLSWFPTQLRPVIHGALMSLLEPHLRRALNYADPPPTVAAAVQVALGLRKALVARMPARRDRLSPLDTMRLRTYPTGYDIAKVGTFPTRRVSSVD